MQLKQEYPRCVLEHNNIEKNDNLLAKLWIIIILFFPTKYFLIYHILIFIPLLALFTICRPALYFESKVLLLFLLYYLTGCVIRNLFNPENVRDIIELFRFMPLLLFFLFRYVFDSLFVFSIRCTIVYLLINTLVCILQYSYKANSALVTFIGYIYNSPKHFEESLLMNSRALGLSMGPNSNAVVILTCVIFILFKFKARSGLQMLIKYTSVILGLLSIILSQSQTGFITIAVVILALFIVSLIRYPLRTFVITLLLALLGVCTLSFTSVSDMFNGKDNKLYYLTTLFEQGTERSSYVLREEKRNIMLEHAAESPSYAFIGWGKDYFGDFTSATDNEHLYIGLVYGPLIWFVVITSSFIISLRYLRLFFQKGGYQYLFVPSLILSGVIFALPAAFITYPQSLMLAALFLNYDSKNNQ